jgi:hypothetical protein
MTNRIGAAVAALCAALLVAPAAAQDTVSMAYEPNSTDAPPVRLAGACAITVTGIGDQRNNKETVGSEFRPLLSPDPLPWVEKSLAQLGAYGYTVSRAASAKPGEVALSADLRRAYTFHGPLRLNGVVAIDARITAPDGKRIEKKYRAFGSKTNMWGAVDEYMTALNYAMNNLLGQMSADLLKVCANK